MSRAILLLALLSMALPALAAIPQTSVEPIAKQAEAARSAGKIADAIDLYAKAVRLRPGWGEGWWALGTLLYDQDRFAEATNAFRHFIATTAKPGPAYAFLALCEYETDDYAHALQHFRKWTALGWAGTPELIDVANFHFALLLSHEGRFIEALYLLATEVQRRGEGAALTEAMGLASLRMKELPKEYPPEKREMVWLAGKAAVYASLPPGDFDRANEYARRLLAHYNKEPGIHYFYGTLLLMQNKKLKAAQEFESELQESPNHVATMLQLARLRLDENEPPEALKLSQRAAVLDPKNADAHHLLGRVLLEDGKPAESVRELEVARRLAPDVAIIRSHLAMAYQRLGRDKEAKAELANFLVLKKKEGVFASAEEKLRVPPAPESPR